jgi:hypothetical protein
LIIYALRVIRTRVADFGFGMWKEPLSSPDSNVGPMFGRTQELEGIESAREFKLTVLAIYEEVAVKR